MVVEDDEQYAKVFTAGVYQGGGDFSTQVSNRGGNLIFLETFFFLLESLM